MASRTRHHSMVTSCTVSADGTRISYLTTGRGPSVIVIPGVLSVAADYSAFARALGEEFTVHTIERRGRGESGPQGEAYVIQPSIWSWSAFRRCCRSARPSVSLGSITSGSSEPLRGRWRQGLRTSFSKAARERAKVFVLTQPDPPLDPVTEHEDRWLSSRTPP